MVVRLDVFARQVGPKIIRRHACLSICFLREHDYAVYTRKDRCLNLWLSVCALFIACDLSARLDAVLFGPVGGLLGLKVLMYAVELISGKLIFLCHARVGETLSSQAVEDDCCFTCCFKWIRKYAMGCAILMTPYVLVELGIDFFDYSTHAMGDFTIGSTHYVVANRTYDLPDCVNCHNATSVAYWRNRTYYEGTSFICCTYPGEVFEKFASFMLPNYSLFEPLESLFVYGFHHLIGCGEVAQCFGVADL